MQTYRLKALITSMLALAAIASLQSSPAMAASFPCEKAKSSVEKMICGDPELSILDEHLGRYYSIARTALAHADACFVGNQQSWLRATRDACKDVTCLKRVYLQRLAELDALQPGASSLRNVELPREMPLVWIIPPALDEVAAPRNRSTTPLVARGKLFSEIVGGDGYAIQVPNGKKYLVVPLMFLEAPTVDALAGLARVPSATYEVRGQAETASDGGKHFAPGRCTFVYRASP